MPIIFSKFPAGGSLKQFVHYGQEILSGKQLNKCFILLFYYILGKFRQFDYGWIINLLKYGTLDPPDYDFSQIAAPVALFYGANDMLAATEVIFFKLKKKISE